MSWMAVDEELGLRARELVTRGRLCAGVLSPDGPAVSRFKGGA